MQAKEILNSHRESLGKLSEILIKRETIEKEQFEALLDGSSEADVFGAEAPPAARGPDPGPPGRREARGTAAAAAAWARRRHRRVADGLRPPLAACSVAHVLPHTSLPASLPGTPGVASAGPR